MAAKASLLRRSRYRGCLLGALLGDCLGGGFEARESVSAAELLRFVRALASPPRGGSAAEPGEESSGGGGKSEGVRVSKILCYSDDTALAHSLVRFAEEYDKDPDRSYGGSVVTVFKKLLSPKCRDVFEPARQQFNGKGSYGNGGAMRVAGISLAYSDVQDVKKFAKLSAELTHANSLGYNGAILQALAVHFALRGESDQYKFLDQLIGQMEDVEADDKSVADARMSDVLLELGNGIAALHSVPTAIYSFLRCMESHPDVPDSYNCLQRTIMYCILLGGDTDTIATMAGAMAGAFYGEEQVPPSWKESCEAYEEAEKLADALCERYHQSA
ncbi:hypothetical protein Chor_001700 [Crotalus horridus]